MLNKSCTDHCRHWLCLLSLLAVSLMKTLPVHITLSPWSSTGRFINTLTQSLI